MIETDAIRAALRCEGVPTIMESAALAELEHLVAELTRLQDSERRLYNVELQQLRTYREALQQGLELCSHMPDNRAAASMARLFREALADGMLRE